MKGRGILLPAVAAALLSGAFGASAQDSAPAGPLGDSAAAADAPLRQGEDDPMPRVATSPAAAQSAAADELVLERTEVTGNRELPKVLYIVPWQKSDPGALMGKPANTLLDEVLAPLDREEFIRQVDYYSDVFGNAESPAMRAPAAPDSTSGHDTGARAAGE